MKRTRGLFLWGMLAGCLVAWGGPLPASTDSLSATSLDESGGVPREAFRDFSWPGSSDFDLSGVELAPASLYTITICTAVFATAGSYDAGFDTPVATDPSLAWALADGSGALFTRDEPPAGDFSVGPPLPWPAGKPLVYTSGFPVLLGLNPAALTATALELRLTP